MRRAVEPDVQLRTEKHRIVVSGLAVRQQEQRVKVAVPVVRAVGKRAVYGDAERTVFLPQRFDDLIRDTHRRLKLRGDIDVFAAQRDCRAVHRLGAFRVREQPLVAGGEIFVLRRATAQRGLFRIRPARQRDEHAKARRFVRVAGGIVQRRGVDLHEHPGGDAERLHLRGIEHAVFDLVLLGKQKDKVAETEIEFAVAVVFKAVKLCIAPPAHAELHRHAAEHARPIVRERFARLERSNGRLIRRAALRQGDLLHFAQQRRALYTGMHAPVARELRIVYRTDLHSGLPVFYSPIVSEKAPQDKREVSCSCGTFYRFIF